MRALAAVALVLLLGLSPPPAAAPAYPVKNHLEVMSGTLQPQTNQSYSLRFGDGPLSQGWVFLLEARVQGGSLGAQIALGGNTKTWTIPASERWYGTTILQETGAYTLTFSNPGSAEVTFWAYFDQSCNCAYKWFPREMHEGLLIFDTDVPKASTVVAQFNKPSAMTMRVTAARLANPDGQWPSDFAKLGEADSPVLRQADPAIPPVSLYELRVPVTEPTRVYYFVQAVSYVAANDTATDDSARAVAPSIDFAAPPPSSISPFVFIGVAAALAVAGAAIWRWPSVSERAAAFLQRDGRRSAAPGPARKDASRAGKGGKGGKNVKPAHRGGGRGGRRTQTSRGRSRRS